MHGTTVVDIQETLAAVNARTLRDATCKSMVANPKVFNPAKLIVSALHRLRERNGHAVVRDKEFQRLWAHSAEFLLARSAQRPESDRRHKAQRQKSLVIAFMWSQQITQRVAGLVVLCAARQETGRGESLAVRTTQLFGATLVRNRTR